MPYVVGAFSWDERATLLAPHVTEHANHAGYARVNAADRTQSLLSGRTALERFTLPSGPTVRLTQDVLADVLVAAAVLDECRAPVPATSRSTEPISTR